MIVVSPAVRPEYRPARRVWQSARLNDRARIEKSATRDHFPGTE
jgi:hypothetical protein